MRCRMYITGLLLVCLPAASTAEENATDGLSRHPGPEATNEAAAATQARASGVLAEASSSREPRLYADSFLVWVYREAERSPTPLGYLRGGQSVPLRLPEPVSRKGCSGGWFAVAPAGFVCHDRKTSKEPTRYSRGMAELGPRSSPAPFDYALSMGSPAYRRIPTADEVARRERKYGRAKHRPLPPHWQGHEELVGAGPLESGEPAWFLNDGGSVSRQHDSRLVRREVPFGSMLALTGSFEANGRIYLQSADGTIVPGERMRLFRTSTFRGVRLGSGLALPLAWTRRPTARMRLTGACTAEDSPSLHSIVPGRAAHVSPQCLQPAQTGETDVRQLFPLTGRRLSSSGETFLETRAGDWLAASALYVADKTDLAGQSEQFIHFSISQGTLTAYERGQAIYATLASPGIGGQPRSAETALEDRATPVGSYRIHFKHRSDDMSPEAGEHRSFWIADVPAAMYFKLPFAIHVAYWHESFGEPMSGGCINVSPTDGRWLFEWTSPHVPDDWYGVSASREFGLGTRITIAR